MNLRELTTEAVNQRGVCTANDLVPDLPTMSRAQIMVALRDAHTEGHIELLQRGTRNGPLSVYGPKVAHAAPVNSIWQMADRAAQNNA